MLRKCKKPSVGAETEMSRGFRRKFRRGLLEGRDPVSGNRIVHYGRYFGKTQCSSSTIFSEQIGRINSQSFFRRVFFSKTIRGPIITIIDRSEWIDRWE